MKIAFIARPGRDTHDLLGRLVKRYGNVDANDADVIVALGGDGFMLEILHHYIDHNIPVYGINCGTIGFLMNATSIDHLHDRLESAETAELHPLVMLATTKDGSVHKAYAINEVALLRERHSAAKIKICIDHIVRMETLTCDGVMVATPAGSTAYNFSAMGPILPLNSQLLTLTPISPFRPRGWRGALISHHSNVEFYNNDPDSRPLSATADFTEIRHITHVKVFEDRKKSVKLLFDKGRHLNERILAEQFFNEPSPPIETNLCK